MPDAPTPVLPAYTPATPTAPTAIQSGGQPSAPTAPANSTGSGTVSAPTAPTAVQSGGPPSAPTAPSAPIASAPPLAPAAATLLLNPTGSNNDILLTAKSIGPSGNDLAAALVVGSIEDEPYDNSPPQIIQTGSYAIISGPAYRMRITGSLTTNGSTPAAFPDLIGSPVVDDRSSWSADGEAHIPGDNNALMWFASGSCWRLQQGAGVWLSYDNVQSPALCTTWVPQGSATGTPVITPLAASAAQMITKINSTAYLPFTASNGPGSDGSGAVAQVLPEYFTGGSGPIAPTPVHP